MSRGKSTRTLPGPHASLFFLINSHGELFRLFFARNNFLSEKGLPLPKATSTGTTIVGCLFEDGIVLGADTRATEGPIVADKNCEKIHYISESIRCCGAGTAADTEFTTALISSNMELHALHTGRKPRVVTAMTMLKQMLFQYHGQIGAALVLGGVDATGPNLFTIHPHGSTSSWRPNMTALTLVKHAISAGIFNDLGSGSNVDACIITATHTEMLRQQKTYGFRRGTTAWKRETVKSLIVDEEITQLVGEAMDTT
ncbi:20S proteasome subunit [Desarmillaria tabescens]|uniref:20S proteasome subunit n=1 Tax=Armillaria tabescens TaxID=1929756 RepID=A0AA39JQR4_ARMTA|nr:20S proteasome subunit [Desarmillaria tabescens]KAK0446081.1 20S proteasome subunit [Desarmillaria tabescens]